MDVLDFARYVGALFVTVALIAGFALALRRFGPTLGLARFGAGGVGKRRFEVAETLILDARRRVVVVREPGREHVILLGVGETLIESRAASEHGDEGDAA